MLKASLRERKEPVFSVSINHFLWTPHERYNHIYSNQIFVDLGVKVA